MSGVGVVAALGFATIVLNNRSDSQLSPANSGGDDSLVTQTSDDSRTTEPGESVPETSTPTVTNAVSSNTKPAGSTNTTAAVPGQSGNANSATTTPVVVPSVTNPPDATTTTTAESSGTDETRTVVSRGGTVTVRLQAGVLTLLETAPSAGFTPDIEMQESARIRVRFDTSNGYSRIEVTIGSDGHMLVDVQENYSGG